MDESEAASNGAASALSSERTAAAITALDPATVGGSSDHGSAVGRPSVQATLGSRPAAGLTGRFRTAIATAAATAASEPTRPLSIVTLCALLLLPPLFVYAVLTAVRRFARAAMRVFDRVLDRVRHGGYTTVKTVEQHSNHKARLDACLDDDDEGGEEGGEEEGATDEGVKEGGEEEGAAPLGGCGPGDGHANAGSRSSSKGTDVDLHASEQLVHGGRGVRPTRAKAGGLRATRAKPNKGSSAPGKAVSTGTAKEVPKILAAPRVPKQPTPPPAPLPPLTPPPANPPAPMAPPAAPAPLPTAPPAPPVELASQPSASATAGDMAGDPVQRGSLPPLHTPHSPDRCGDDLFPLEPAKARPLCALPTINTMPAECHPCASHAILLRASVEPGTLAGQEN